MCAQFREMDNNGNPFVQVKKNIYLHLSTKYVEMNLK